MITATDVLHSHSCRVCPFAWGARKKGVMVMRRETHTARCGWLTIVNSAPIALTGAIVTLLLWPPTTRAQSRDQLDAAREKMVETAVIGAGVTNPRVIEAMRKTPRHEFLARQYRKQAYEDMSLPIGDQQTISSPFIVAFMTEALDPQPTDRVLEIGTGSGYQAAILSGLVRAVYSIEIVETLGLSAQRTLQRLRYDNVHVRVGDGFQGWAEHAPYDKIIVTCSPENVPQPLIDQLREGGIIVIPVGERYSQTLYVMRKREGKLEQEALRPTLFVPMTGTAEEAREILPDPKNPQISNGGFEKPALTTGFVPDWYYQRQATQVHDKTAPEGEFFLTITNEEPGRPGWAMQGFPVDGRSVSQLQLSGWVKYQNVRPGQTSEQMPGIIVTFFDESRKQSPPRWIGPFRGSADWQHQSELIRVPPSAREAIIRIGLFGAVGTISFDDVRVAPTTK